MAVFFIAPNRRLNESTGALVLGMGTAVPGHFMRQNEVAQFMSTVVSHAAPEGDRERLVELIARLYSRSGIDKRHSYVEGSRPR